MIEHSEHDLRELDRIDCGALHQLWFFFPLGKTVLLRIALVGLIIVVGLILLAAQRYCANQRLANKRRNKNES